MQRSHTNRILGYLRQHRSLILWGLASLIVTDVLGLIPPWLVKNAIDALPSLSGPGQLIPYLGLILLVVLGQAVFRFAWRQALFGVSREVEYELRNDLFRHLQSLDRASFLKFGIGDLMSRCTNDLVAIQELIAYFGLVVVDSCLIIVMALILMTFIDPILTMVALIPMPLLSVAFFYFGRRVRSKANRVQAALADLTDMVQESLTGIHVIQTYTLEDVRGNQYRDCTEEYIRQNLDLARLRGVFYSTLTFLAGCAGVIVLWFGGHRVIENYLTLGGFVAFNSYLLMLTWPMMSVGFMINLIQRGRASLDRLDQIFEQRPLVEDPEEPEPLHHMAANLRFHDVGFRYPGSDDWALKHITLQIPAGSIVGITGPVGSGKTTLLELIPRIFDPTEGGVTINGRNIRVVSLQALRRDMAWVAQEPFLFSDNVAENIRFAMPRRPKEDIAEMARLACLDKDEDAFPQGWDTPIGEQGVMVSGGQRQRVAIARALMCSPQILLLDDAFAHLDEETESLVLKNILDTLPDCTLLFSSHRFSSLRKADWLIVLQKGRLIQQGTVESLLKTCGYFRTLYRKQQLVVELNRMAGK